MPIISIKLKQKGMRHYFLLYLVSIDLKYTIVTLHNFYYFIIILRSISELHLFVVYGCFFSHFRVQIELKRHPMVKHIMTVQKHQKLKACYKSEKKLLLYSFSVIMNCYIFHIYIVDHVISGYR